MSKYFGDFFDGVRHKLGIVDVLLQLLEHSVGNVIFVVVVKTLQKVRISEQNLCRCPVGPEQDRGRLTVDKAIQTGLIY